MKKLFLLLACVATYIAACTMTVNAQTKMHIWMQGGNIPFELASVDSVTFSGYAEEEFTLSESNVFLYTGEQYQLTANKPVDQWMSIDPTVATVTDGLVTALSDGITTIIATFNGEAKTCLITVYTNPSVLLTLTGSQIWPVIMDDVTYAANESKVVASFEQNDVDQFQYLMGEHLSRWRGCRFERYGQ